MKQITVIGSGISGLASAWLLHQSGRYQVTLLEANHYFGGHSNAVDVQLDGATYPVDTGFLVFNHKTYPHLTALFAHLNIDTPDSDMSFGVSIEQSKTKRLEWAGDNLGTVFAQKKNLLNVRFWQMLRDIFRFGRHAERYLAESERDQLTLGELLDRHHYSQSFQHNYLLPMGAAIWSSAVSDIRDFPASSFLRFCLNHVLLSVNGRPQWKTVGGSSRQYVQTIIGQLPDSRLNHTVVAIDRPTDTSNTGSANTDTANTDPAKPKIILHVDTPNGREQLHTDAVVFACHTNQTLAILGDQASVAERQILAAIRYAPNSAYLHTDSTQMPQNRRVWSSWNYLSQPDHSEPVAVTYWLNRLQPLPFRTPLLLTLNPSQPIDPSKILRVFAYEHPQMDQAALKAQQRLASIQGVQQCYFAGAWAGYGFHEDGLKAAIAAVAGLGVTPPWTTR